MDSAGKQGTLRNRGLRAVNVFCAFPCSKARVVLLQKRKKLLCPLVNTERGKVSFLCSSLDGIYDLVCQLDLRLDASAVSMGAVDLRASGISASSRFSALLMTCSYSPG